jgi:hypothetical protein
LGSWALGPLGSWALGLLGSWALGSLGYWALGLLGPWALGPLGSWALGLLGPWALGPLGSRALGLLALGPSSPWALWSLGTWALGPLGSWALGPLGSWEILILKSCSRSTLIRRCLFLKNSKNFEILFFLIFSDFFCFFRKNLKNRLQFFDFFEKIIFEKWTTSSLDDARFPTCSFPISHISQTQSDFRVSFQTSLWLYQSLNFDHLGVFLSSVMVRNASWGS